MKAPIVLRIVVVGGVRFPLDMLRYDSAWPSTELDSGRIERTFDVPGPGTLVQVELRGLRRPTRERWQSFGWNVMEVSE